RAVHERVDAAEGRDRPLDESLALRAVGDVGRHLEHDRVEPGGADGGLGVVELRRRTRGDGDAARPLARRERRELDAEARTDARDDDDLVLKQHSVPPFAAEDEALAIRREVAPDAL